MKPLSVIARFVAQPGREDDLATQLTALLEPTRGEAGCIDYELHRSLEQPGTFMFTEAWATRDAWERHKASPHFTAFDGNSGAVVASLDVFVGEVI